MRNIDPGGLMWVDSILSDDMDKLTWMVNELIEELMDLDLEDGVLLKVGSRGKNWNTSVDEASDM